MSVPVAVDRLEPAGQFGAGPTFGAGSMVLLSASTLDSSLAGGGQAKRPSQHADPVSTAGSMAWHKHDHLVLMDKSKPKCELSHQFFIARFCFTILPLLSL